KLAQAFGSITSHSSEENGNDIAAPKFVHALQKNIDGRAVSTIEGMACIAEAAIGRKDKVVFGPGEQDGCGFRPVIFGSDANCEPSLISEPFREAFGELCIDMLND